MESKKSRKIEMKRIEKKPQRSVAFCKRRDGLFSKARSLHNLSGAHIAIVVFSESGRPYVHGSPSFDATVERYLAAGTRPVSSLPVSGHGIADSGGFERHDLIFPGGFTVDPFSASPASGVDSGEFEQRYLTSSDAIGDRPVSSFPVSVDGIADSGGFQRQDLIFPGGFTADPFSASPASGADSGEFEWQYLTSSDAIGDRPISSFPADSGGCTAGPFSASPASGVDSGELEQQYLTCSSAIGDGPTSSLPVDVDVMSWFDMLEQSLADLDENGSGPISPELVDGFTELSDLERQHVKSSVDPFSASPASGVESSAVTWEDEAFVMSLLDLE